MFLLNLRKKLTDIFSFFKNIDAKKIEEFIEESFFDILKVTAIIGGVIVVFVLVISFLVAHNSPSQNIVKNEKEKITKDKIIPDSDLLLKDEFVFPPVGSFDITSDYIDFMSIKKFKIPDFDTTINNYDIILADTLDESCKFNFEKRRKP